MMHKPTEQEIEAVKRVRYLNYDYNAPHLVRMGDGTGRMVFKYWPSKESDKDIDALISTVRFAAKVVADWEDE